MRRLLALPLLAAALAVTAGGVAQGAATTPTTLGIRHSAASGGSFSGRVKSRVAACLSGRRVTVYRKKAGPDRMIGSTTSAASGAWLVDPASRLAAGDYYARTPAARRGASACSSARSVTTHSS